jgi:hypothetical protein
MVHFVGQVYPSRGYLPGGLAGVCLQTLWGGLGVVAGVFRVG